MKWNSQWRSPGYQYREDHKERDQKIYLLRHSWATEKGLVKPAENGWYDDITKVGEEVFCSCFATWLRTLGALPESMLTVRGRESLEKARKSAKGN